MFSKVYFIIIMGLVWFSLLNLQLVRGQSADQGWTIPTNLSHSGATTNPAMVIDNNKVIHVIWQDNHAGTLLCRKYWESLECSEISQISLREYYPRLLTDSKGQIYAFWTMIRAFSL